MKKMYVSDMTLRGMKQNLSFRERLDIAAKLERAGVDAIELPALSGGKEAAVICRTIADAASCRVCLPAGDTEEAVQQAWLCLANAKNPCLQIILPVSTVQMEYMYHLKAAKMLEKVANLCRAAAALCPNVEFIAQDASRAEAGFAAACCKAAVENGASIVTLCDDSGIYFPADFAKLVEEVRACCDATVLVQPNDNLSMAAACAVEALKAGADGVKTAAGCQDCLGAHVLANILRAKGDTLSLESGLDVTAIGSILSAIGQTVSAAAELAPSQSTLVLSQESTLADISTAADALGYELSSQDLGKVYQEFQNMCRSKESIGEKELEAIIATTAMQVPSTYHLSSFVVNSGNIITATANITLEKDGKSYSGVSTGDGPVDAAFHAIEQIIGHHYELDDFQIQAVTKGREAVGSSLIRLRANGKLYSGNGVSTDIIAACLRAYINALNKIVYEGK